MIITATLPYPPSANRYWRVARNGRPYVSKETKLYKTAVWSQMYMHDPLEAEVYLIVDIYRPRKSGDLDNRLKVLQDALQNYAYIDDSQIVAIYARRHDDKECPRAEVFVTDDKFSFYDQVAGCCGFDLLRA